MILKVGLKKSTDINDNVFKKILMLYPEENLLEHRVFKNALRKGSITIKELQDASETIHIPWQLFLLDENFLDKEFEHIENQRKDKLPGHALGIEKREGEGVITSKRIIDRQIRLQAFVSSDIKKKCDFVGALKSKTISESVQFIIQYFSINMTTFREKDSGENSLIYLIKQIQSKGDINISRGVLSNGILPSFSGARDVYKNTSGFVLKDINVPFIFLPHEINPVENHFRQIYTLFYLLVVIGLDEYSYAIEPGFSFKKIKEEGKYKKIHKIVSILLLPISETNLIDDGSLSKVKINEFKDKFKLSYSAVLRILRIRKRINRDTYESLELPKRARSLARFQVPSFFSSPLISTSVGKFCGNISFGYINSSIKTNSITSTQAQLLIFGRVRKDAYKKYMKKI